MMYDLCQVARYLPGGILSTSVGMGLREVAFRDKRSIREVCEIAKEHFIRTGGAERSYARRPAG